MSDAAPVDRERPVFPTDGTRTYGLMEVMRGSRPAVGVGPEDTVLSWPHLLFRELLLALAVLAAVWAVALWVPAPLEELANPTVTPNPAKAPWYFSGLQELLVYFDPWIAGVCIPGAIILGLMAIPYVDRNPRGMGSYTLRRRPLAVGFFTVGLLLWFVLILIGQLFRGPNWAWYWPWEQWDAHRLTVGETWNLPPAAGIAVLAAGVVLGIGAPAVLFPRFRRALGWPRFVIVTAGLLGLAGVLGKITARLLLDLKYVLRTEWFNL